MTLIIMVSVYSIYCVGSIPFSRSSYGSLERGEGQGRSALCIPRFLIPTSGIYRIIKIAFDVCKDKYLFQIIFAMFHFFSARAYALTEGENQFFSFERVSTQLRILSL